MAPSVFRVSTSDSPFETLEADAVIEMISAPRRLAAISKLVRVRVEASKNRLTMVRSAKNSKRLNGLPGRRLKILGARQDRFYILAVERFDIEQSPASSL